MFPDMMKRRQLLLTGLAAPAFLVPALRAGPATATDVAHFFNAKVTSAREWLARLEGKQTPVLSAFEDRRRKKR